MSLAMHPLAETSNGRLWRCGRLFVAVVEGTPEEIGRAHGRLLATQIQAGAPPYFAARLIGASADSVFEDLTRQLPSDYRAELEGMANGAGLPTEVLRRATLTSEALQVLAAHDAARAPERPAAGCTAAIARAGACAGGQLLYGKNQDYSGAGYWDAAHLLLVTKLKGAIPYAKVTTAGVLKGNISLNAEGLAIGGHFIFSAGATSTGASFTVLENEVMRRASTIDEAVAILSQPRAGAFAFVVSHAATNRAVIVEADSRGIRVREPQSDAFAFSNIFAEGDLGDRDLLRNHGAHRNPAARERRMSELLTKSSPSLTPAGVAECLGDGWDIPSDRLRPVCTSISQVLTVASAVVEGAALRIWVADGEAPVSSGRYLGFDLSPAFAGEGPPALVGSIAPQHDLESTRRVAGARACARAEYLLYKGRAAEARAVLEEAVRRDPSEPHFLRLLARLALRAGNFDSAIELLSQALTLKQSRNELVESHWWRGIAHQAAGRSGADDFRRGLALAAMQPSQPLDHATPKLIMLLNASLKSETPPDVVIRTPLDFSMTGPLA